MINTRNNLGMRGSGNRASIVFGMALALAAVILLASDASSQELATTFDVVGTVVDAENGQPLVGVWVSIQGSEWGSVTNEQGRFRLPEMNAGGMALSIEQLGYETLEWEDDVSADAATLALELEPNPIVLDGLRVVTDRFRARRNAVATSVFAYGLDDLATTSQETALDFISLRSGSRATGCSGRRGDLCFWVRGRMVEPVVYLDEAPVLGGLEYLDTFAPSELYMVEIYGGGRHIRAYTPRFMERAAKQRLSPIALTF